MDLEKILFEEQEHIVKITLNNPERKNAFDLETRLELMEVFEKIRDDNAVKAIIMTGAGDAFSSGGDIATMVGEEFTAVGARMRLKRAHRLIRTMLEIEKPIIAAINGAAAGGGISAALACDILIASDRARFLFSFVKIGVAPDLGSYYLLPLRIGVPRAKELFLTGAVIDAPEAERMGLVNRMVPHNKLMKEAFTLASNFATGPSQSYAMIKSALNRWPTALETFLEMESTMQAVAFSSEDFDEGRRAFLEKRKPLFRGK
jgi:2-(1,2-epoxy-1,2-dihydrophenyl)acetyl-CoA isomerase